MKITGTLAAVGDVSTALYLRPNQTGEIVLTNTGGHAWSVVLEQQVGGTWGMPVLTFSANTSSTLIAPTGQDTRYRLRLATIASNDTIAYTIQETVAAGSVAVLYDAPAKVGATAGWVVAATDNAGKLATLPASQTGSTLVMRTPELRLGDRIVGHHLVGSIQSAGNAATITSDLRSLTNAAGGAVDASVAAMAAPLSVTANTALGASNTEVKQFDHPVVEGESLYLLVTSTTGASTTEELLGVVLNVIRAA